MAEQFRESVHYNVWYLDHALTFKVRLWEFDEGVRTPYDGTIPTSWALQFYNLPDDAALRLNQALTLSATELSDGVRNVVSADVELDSAVDATTGRVYVKLVAITGGVPTVWEAPWEATVYLIGPTS